MGLSESLESASQSRKKDSIETLSKGGGDWIRKKTGME